MSGFMAALGHLEVRAEQEGLKLVHAAGDWADHLSWDQVKHLLIPAILDVAPGVFTSSRESVTATAADGASEAPASFTTIPTDVLDELKTLFGSWFQRELDGIRAEVGKELDAVHQRLDALTGDQKESGTVTTGAATAAPAKATARRAVARKPAATPK